jgi:hypothetical protein
MGWVRAMNRRRQAQQPNPDRWTEPSRRNFDELAAKRDKMRGK